jgi:hypothetical protein
MPVPQKLRLARRDAEILKDAMLELMFEYLVVAVNDELAFDGVEHDPSPRPFLIFGVANHGGDEVRRASCPPAFPYFVMAVWTRDEVSVFLGCG